MGPTLLLVLSLLGLAGPRGVAGEVGVNATHITVGLTGPFSGLQADYGVRISAGLRVAFAEANAVGGIQSRNLTLTTLDDGYVASRSVANFATLKNQALLLAGVYGSDINLALLPLTVAAGVPNVGPFTGSMATRSPFRESVVNVRASIPDEMVVQAILLVQKLRVHRIAVLYQNDTFGQSCLSAITAALQYVGLDVMVAASYPAGSTAIEPALETIAGYPQKAQAVVLASLESQNVKFIGLFRQDNRTDPNCNFIFYSGSATAAFANKTNRSYWPSFYFTQVVPPLDTPDLDLVTQYQTSAGLYLPPNLNPELISFQAYLGGRLIVEVLKGIPGEITRQSFLDELYNTRLYAVGSLLLGMYSRNFSGCAQIVCGSNMGLRAVFPAVLNSATGLVSYSASLGYYTYPVTQLTFPVTNVVRPLLFGQLIPNDDPGWRRVAEAIGRGLQKAFADLNAAGGVSGRPVQLIQRWFSGDATTALAAFLDRYALLALVGSVVNQSKALRAAPAQIGTLQAARVATDQTFNASDVQVQASIPLQVMALVAFAVRLGLPIHFRAPAGVSGQVALDLMLQSLHSLQQQPASSRTYGSPADAFQGLSTGAVVVLSSDADVQAMFEALVNYPQLRLLTTNARAVHLLASINVANYSQASRVHYPYAFSASSAQTPTATDVLEPTLYGQLLGAVLQTVLKNTVNASLAYSTTDQVLSAWYGTQYKFNGVTLGPYYSAACSAETTADCECNEGVRQVTVLNALRQAVPFEFHYAQSECHVTYQALIIPPPEGNWYIGVAAGVPAGLVVLGLVGWWLSRRGRRDNAAAPKDEQEPFCILFTDIQSSTNLWATVPDVMAIALHAHHELIRRLVSKHRLYEVKTIGDSFMCATCSPHHAVEFALDLQRAMFHHDWGTDRIDTAYLMHHDGDVGRFDGAHNGWNGLRVRLGVHHGLGSVHLDPVSKGYDYYGTVVNTAARVEAVCHGGQIGITQAVYDALEAEFPGAVVTDLGEHILRGLDAPVHLYQLVPEELSARRFPPLRLERAAVVEDQTEFTTKHSFTRSQVVPVYGPHSAYGSASPKSHAPHSPMATRTVGASTAMSHLTHGSHWVEGHPLVRAGKLSAHELAVRYLTVLKALTTLLETQTQRVRGASVRAFCERLQVKNHGTDGPQLEETLNGVVQRVLPAALSAVGWDPPRKASGGSRRASSVYPLDTPALGPPSPVSDCHTPVKMLTPVEIPPLVPVDV